MAIETGPVGWDPPAEMSTPTPEPSAVKDAWLDWEEGTEEGLALTESTAPSGSDPAGTATDTLLI
jgi:hypothetical protein